MFVSSALPAISAARLFPNFPEKGRLRYSQSLEEKFDGRRKHAEAVFDAPPEVDRGSVFKIFSRAAYLSDSEPEIHRLGKHLVIEYEVIGVLFERKRFEHRAAECSKAGMVFRQFRAEHQVLYEREKPVRNILVERHPAFQRFSAEDPGPSTRS